MRIELNLNLKTLNHPLVVKMNTSKSLIALQQAAKRRSSIDKTKLLQNAETNEPSTLSEAKTTRARVRKQSTSRRSHLQNSAATSKMQNPPLKISQSALKTIGRKRVSAAEQESLESEISEPKDIEEGKAQTPMPIVRRDSFSLDPEAYRTSMYEFQGRLNFT